MGPERNRSTTHDAGRICGWVFAFGLGAAALTGHAGETVAGAETTGESSPFHAPTHSTSSASPPSAVSSSAAPRRAHSAPTRESIPAGTARRQGPARAPALVRAPAHPRAFDSAAAQPTPTGLFRQIQRTFFNQAPTTRYTPSETNVVDGLVVGSLNPGDFDDDAVTFTHTDPQYGEVEIAADGSFTYTPGPGYPGHDSFDVTVSDEASGFHIHGLIGLLNLVSFGLIGKPGHETTRTVDLGFQRTEIISIPNTPNLNGPVDFRFLPDGRIVVAEKFGAIAIVEGGVLQEPLIVLPALTGVEKGVNGIEVDPDFELNGYLYVAYTTLDNRDRLSRITVADGSVDPASEFVLVEGDQEAGPSHHGGAIAFGPDGSIYYSMGDNSKPANSQDLSTLHGKILRLNPDGTVPADNPFVGVDGVLPQIYAYGFRNPYRMTFTPDGQLLVADVGEVTWEELNLVTAGGNYGWWPGEGPCDDCGYVNPIYAYRRDGVGAALTSVLVYTGTTFDPSFQNKVFIADWVQGWMKVLTCADDFSSCGNPTTFDADAGLTVNLLQGPDGNIYQLTYDLFFPGTLNRIEPVG